MYNHSQFPFHISGKCIQLLFPGRRGTCGQGEEGMAGVQCVCVCVCLWLVQLPWLMGKAVKQQARITNSRQKRPPTSTPTFPAQFTPDQMSFGTSLKSDATYATLDVKHHTFPLLASTLANFSHRSFFFPHFFCVPSSWHF